MFLLKLMAKVSKTLVRPEFDSFIPHLPGFLDKEQLYVTDQLDETVLFAFWRALWNWKSLKDHVSGQHK